jgi:hypothetical protein
VADSYSHRDGEQQNLQVIGRRMNCVWHRNRIEPEEQQKCCLAAEKETQCLRLHAASPLQDSENAADDKAAQSNN